MRKAYARPHMGSPPTHLSLVGTGTQHPPVGPAAPRETALPRVLSLDAHGRILDWMQWQDAVCLYARGAVAWTLGEPCLTVHGGTSRFTGRQIVLWSLWTLTVVGTAFWRWYGDITAQQPVDMLGLVIYSVSLLVR